MIKMIPKLTHFWVWPRFRFLQRQKGRFFDLLPKGPSIHKDTTWSPESLIPICWAQSHESNEGFTTAFTEWNVGFASSLKLLDQD